ncbi:hypothetical protein BCV69DRAFT_314579 [Microstroma glucosiphilum]|uniref:Uncharacterized protein n=1 Tax=Pseudomicrostroma glucosiphilum TaxID=1684307 RepID=A0A316TYK7_9BASI|nr:hypothetical protein BCV69DRAFT_314579 [Pseudomicrostroma glucosiphilum]PWN18369.1 hypothetical protein BCV69DRAFT_314579 [Pseudomicrostroma glucosiphilum]
MTHSIVLLHIRGQKDVSRFEESCKSIDLLQECRRTSLQWRRGSGRQSIALRMGASFGGMLASGIRAAKEAINVFDRLEVVEEEVIREREPHHKASMTSTAFISRTPRLSLGGSAIAKDVSGMTFGLMSLIRIDDSHCPLEDRAFASMRVSGVALC